MANLCLLFENVVKSYSITPNVEKKKSVFSSKTLRCVYWHIPAIISCLGTGVLFFLNFSEYSIGAEVGKTTRQTRNIIGALQLAAKLHEMIIISSLANIARQWIQLCLMNNGTLLGLLGSETLFYNLSLLTSREFWVGARYCLSGLRGGPSRGSGWRGKSEPPSEQQRLRRSLTPLLAFFFVGCLLCSLSGPASAVLMTPRQDWFYQTSLTINSTHKRLDILVPGHQPHILIDWYLSYDTYLDSSDPSTLNYTSYDPMQNYSTSYYRPEEYWHGLDGATLSRENSNHRFYDGSSWISVNTSTVLDRDIFNWTGNGGTTFTGLMYGDRIGAYKSAQLHRTTNQTCATCRGADDKFVVDLTGIESYTVCRAREKQTCDISRRSDNTSRPEWCYQDTVPGSLDGELRSNQDLIPLFQVTLDSSDPLNVTVWMTEGRPLLRKELFSDSMITLLEFSLEDDSDEHILLVCSTSAMLKTATASSSGWSVDLEFSPDWTIFHDYLSYYENGAIEKAPPKRLLYHKNWLDSMVEPGWDKDLRSRRPPRVAPLPTGPQRTYTPRAQLQPTNDTSSPLGAYAQGLISNYKFGKDSSAFDEYIHPIELLVGGSYLSFLLFMPHSSTQYTGIPTHTRDGGPILPDYLMPEPILDYTKFTYPPISANYYVYGFRISTRTGIFGVVILSTHVFLVLLGSIWQCYRGTIIQSWKSIPEYATLCLGSDPTTDVVENTCAGISLDETLSKVIKIRDTGGEHLELVVLAPGDAAKGSVVDTDEQYGYLGRKRLRRNRKKKKRS